MATSTASSRDFLAAIFSPPLARLAWKEFRTLRAFWITLAVIAVLWQVLLPLIRIPGLAQIGSSGLPAMFALGAAVLLFAWETEERTMILLRIYPLTRGSVFFAKVSVGLLGAINISASLYIFGISSYVAVLFSIQ